MQTKNDLRDAVIEREDELAVWKLVAAKLAYLVCKGDGIIGNETLWEREAASLLNVCLAAEAEKAGL